MPEGSISDDETPINYTTKNARKRRHPSQMMRSKFHEQNARRRRRRRKHLK